MAGIAITFGALLIALGFGGYFGAEGASFTALIPSIFGLAIFGLGLAALRKDWRKTAMHVAVVVGLVGFAFTISALVTVVRQLLSEPSLLAKSAMAILCGLFVILSIKSFIDARLRRRSGDEE